MDYHLVEKQILRALFMFFKSLTRGIFACLIQTCICSNLNVTLKQETVGKTLPTFLECIFFFFFFPKPVVAFKFSLFIAIYMKLLLVCCTKVREKYVLVPPHTKKLFKKLSFSILQSAVVRCSQCLLWKSTKLFQSDGQILTHRCIGIFDLVFQPNLVHIKQTKISHSVFQCICGTAIKTSCFLPPL